LRWKGEISNSIFELIRLGELSFFMLPTVGPYHFLEPIGQGSFGQVWRCVHCFTGQQLACKVVLLRTIREDDRLFDNFMNELRANSEIRHPGIVRLFDILYDQESIFLFLELCEGGTLEDLVRSRNGLPEAEAQRFFSQIMQTIRHIHSLAYAHRDVTLKNILIAGDGSAKLTDFGLCRRRQMNPMFSTVCGTFVYVAPEVITQQPYDGFKVDIWSAGICLYSMVTNHLPWLIDDNTPAQDVWKATGEQICQGNIIYDDTMSEELRDLLSQMLTVSADERPTADDVLNHPWFLGSEDMFAFDGEPDTNLVSMVESLIQVLHV
jgi:serine/threonine protein kinase